MLSSYGTIISTIPLHKSPTSTTPLIQATHTNKETPKHHHTIRRYYPIIATTLGALASVIISTNVGNAEPIRLTAVERQQQRLQQRQQEQDQGETLENIPGELSGLCEEGNEDCNKKGRIQRPKSRQAETCTVKCVNTCIRGGYGAPGEGPFNIRRPIVVFKEGFHSRRYCLVECSDICNLLKDGDDGP